MSRENISRNDSDDIFIFITGMAVGMLGGAIVGLLFAPKSGDRLRGDTQRFVQGLPKRVDDEFRNSNTKTREFIDKTRYNIESQVGKVKKERDADRMAKAKRAEEIAGGYEFN